MKVLVTGGAGYIGSHFVKLLKSNGHEPVVVDNLSRGHKEAVIKNVILEETDLLDFPDLADVFKNHMPDAVVHFAAYAYVGESVEHPEMYYKNNVIGSMNLINACVEFGVNKLVFSSTCSIYGNPYETAHGLKHIALRYFNAAGADPSGELGESHEPETHLIPLVLQTAQKKRNKILVFGNDYETPDGTCIRDYIHVLDLADAHLKALNYLNDGRDSTFINLGTGSGNSVLEIIEKAKSITGKNIPFEIVGRRAGDPAILVADNKKANEFLGWSPKYSIEEILQTAWNWHTNPKY